MNKKIILVSLMVITNASGAPDGQTTLAPLSNTPVVNIDDKQFEKNKPLHGKNTIAPEEQENKPSDSPAKTQSDAQFLADKLTNPHNTPPHHMTKKEAAAQEKTVTIKYEGEDLVDIINELATLKNVNFQLPQGANAIAAKVNFRIEEKLTLDDAWRLLYTLVDLAGYSIEPRPDKYVVKKNSAEIIRDPLPLYIGTPPDQLPATDERIRYVYYLSNIKLSADANSEIPLILTNLLPQPQITSTYKIDETTNGLIIVAKANDIKAAMNIIVSLDKTDFQETLEVVNLHYTSADTIATLFNQDILKSTGEKNYHLSAKQQTEITFFSKQTRLIAEKRTNNLFIVGKPQATERVKDFILKYVDVPLDSGQSILHVHQLQYSRAEDLVSVLTQIVASAAAGGSGQSSAGGTITTSGAFKLLDPNIKILADKPTGENIGYYGGNKLIVAAGHADWKVIEKLIVELDKPQPQVLLEILICDLNVQDQRTIGTLLRDPAKIPLPGTSEFQAYNLGNDGISGVTPAGAIILPNAPITAATTLQSNLLNPYYSAGGTTVSVDQLLTQQSIGPSGSATVVGGNPGSTILSFNDANGATWGLMQILQTMVNSKILSHPHVVAMNNQQATVEIGQQLYLTDETVGSGGTTTTTKQKPVNADLVVKITPRISSANTVLLDIDVEISDFIGVTPTNLNPARTARTVKTSALVLDKDILSLGGLVQVTTAQNINETPILSKIPIIGYLFKSRANNILRQNITVFISPTIIQPRFHGDASEHTNDYVKLAKQYSNEGALFDSLQDPVTRWFFKTDTDAPNIMDKFMEKDEILTQQKQERRPRSKKNKINKNASTVVARNKKEDNPMAQLKQLQELIAHDSNPLLST